MAETFAFQEHHLARVFKGNWQLAGGHGDVDLHDAQRVLRDYVEHGVNVFDVGDIYNNSEQLVGDFLAQCEGDADLRVHTKFVPDLDALEDLAYGDVRSIIERSLGRLQLNSLHLVQFHWWDFNRGDYVATGKHLQQLKDEGLIEQIGLTNTDVEHITPLLEAGVEIASNQIQFSLIDPRPLNGMLEFAQKNNIAIFCYGALAGGLLAGARPGDEPTNRSHIKYGLMVDETEGNYYPDLLCKLDELAEKHRTTRANIAARFILQTAGVSSVILGPRNGKHVDELDALFELQLDETDYALLRQHFEQLRAAVSDDVYSYERDMNGPHGKIMKYNLNGMRSSI